MVQTKEKSMPSGVIMGAIVCTGSSEFGAATVKPGHTVQYHTFAAGSSSCVDALNIAHTAQAQDYQCNMAHQQCCIKLQLCSMLLIACVHMCLVATALMNPFTKCKSVSAMQNELLTHLNEKAGLSFTCVEARYSAMYTNLQGLGF